MHTWYSQRTQSYQNYHYPIFLAEVASTFNEILLTEHLLRTTSDHRMRAYVINRQIDDLRGTLYRQTMFAEFEKSIHAAEEAGEALTLESFKGSTAGCWTPTSGPISRSIRNWSWRGCVFPIFTAHSMSTSMRRESLRRSPWPARSCKPATRRII